MELGFLQRALGQLQIPFRRCAAPEPFHAIRTFAVTMAFVSSSVRSYVTDRSRSPGGVSPPGPGRPPSGTLSQGT